jgi:RNA polymerase sigma factor for flagellar operon FliA
MATIGNQQATLSDSGAQSAAAPASTLDRAHEDRLVREHMPLVGHIVRETLSRVPGHVSREDLVSAGQVGLVLAVRAYDPSREVPLGRYAAQRIRGAVLDELRGLDWASRSVRRRQRELDGVRAQLGMTHGRTPSTAEVAHAAGLSTSEVAAHTDDVARASLLSLQGLTPSGLEELVPAHAPDPSEQLLVRERLDYLRRAVELLPERLRMVVRGYYLDERPMADLAAELGVTESRISQMRAEAMRLMREAMQRALADEPVVSSTPLRQAARRHEAYYAAVADRRSTEAAPAVA